MDEPRIDVTGVYMKIYQISQGSIDQKFEDPKNAFGEHHASYRSTREFCTRSSCAKNAATVPKRLTGRLPMKNALQIISNVNVPNCTELNISSAAQSEKI